MAVECENFQYFKVQDGGQPRLDRLIVISP